MCFADWPWFPLGVRTAGKIIPGAGPESGSAAGQVKVSGCLITALNEGSCSQHLFQRQSSQRTWDGVDRGGVLSPALTDGLNVKEK